MTITPFMPPAYLSGLPTGIWSGVDGLAVLPFLPGQAMSISKSPLWSTKTARAASGRERRTAHWPWPLWRFELQYEVVRHRPTQDELANLWEFFNVAQGQFGPWLFVDPTDCQLAAPTAFAVGDGATTAFQLTRQINSFVEPIYAAYSPVILDNGAAAGAHTVSRGLVTFTTPPVAGHVLAWSGYFYFLCRFAQDDAGFAQIVAQLWEGKALKFTSIRP